MPHHDGISISGSIFIGKTMSIKPVSLPQTVRHISPMQEEQEIILLNKALKHLESEMISHLENENSPQLDRDIADTHLVILSDPDIIQQLHDAIRQNRYAACAAVDVVFQSIITHFKNMDNDYFSQRAEDYLDVSQRLTAIICGSAPTEIGSFSPTDVLITNEITPSQVSLYAKKGLKAYCSARGSYTSHSSILARAMGMTAIVLPGADVLIQKETPIILDATRGKVIISPTAEELADYQIQVQALELTNKALKDILPLPAVTMDDRHVLLKANLEFADEVEGISNLLCDGIGLFRTEFLYQNRSTLPSEDEQKVIYAHILQQLPDQTVTIRTFDLGGDKLAGITNNPVEENPFLGCRGLRFSLSVPAIFKTQLRAILRASAHGKVRIMFPMVIGEQDLQCALDILDECKAELDRDELTYDHDIPVGIMIEVPSAALCAKKLAKKCSFFSIGTNDLVQYTLAVDRNNDNVASYYIPHHPSVLMLLQHTFRSAHEAGIPVSVCGEMASQPRYIPLLIGMGVDELSVNPSSLLAVKAIVRKCDTQLFSLLQSYDFDKSLPDIDHLIYTILQPYYSFSS